MVLNALPLSLSPKQVLLFLHFTYEVTDSQLQPGPKI